MGDQTCFRLPRVCLPRSGIDLRKWAVIACDQYTSEPDYWRRVADAVGDAPSSLHLVYPEVFLGAADAPERIQKIQATMRRYLANGLLREHAGAILVERQIGARTRRGLLLELDLEHYDFSAQSTSLIRPTEGTIVARLAPRVAVRRDAELELPHILVLIDDPAHTVIEPIAAERAALSLLYETELMFGSGNVAGYGIGPAQAEHAVQALTELGQGRRFEQRYGVAAGTPAMLFAVGDGNHSLATAKSIWDEHKQRVGMDHPSRYALVEVENIHDPALEFSPIHRLLFGTSVDVRAALSQAFGPRLSLSVVPSAAAMRARVLAASGGCHAAGLIGPGASFAVIEIDDPRAGLAVALLQTFIDELIQRGGACEVDYIHGDATLERQAQGAGCVGFYLATLDKHDLLRTVVRDGPLPRKTFSMGEADEKRFYIESRRIR